MTVVVTAVPFCAVTTMVTVLSPTASAIGAEALALATGAPLTVTVALLSATVGVRLSAVALFGRSIA
ncbi:hypothetical protein D3C81_1360330 [compost metagenome]